MSFDRDLDRWERRAVSDAELARAHPGEDVGDLLALHERMSTIGGEPVPLDEPALQRFLATLPGRSRPRRRYRSVLLAVAAALLSASMAVAVPGVQHGVSTVTHGVGRLLGITSSPPSPAAPSPASLQTPGRIDHRGGSGGASDHTTGGHDGDTDEGDGSGGAVATDGGDQGQDQNGGGSGSEGGGSGGGSADQGDGGSGSTDTSSGSGSGTDEQGDGSGGDTQASSSDGDTGGQS